MIKTGEFWLNCLSDDIREKWLNNFDTEFDDNQFGLLGDYLIAEMTFYNFIQDSFWWGETPEGHDFWSSVGQTDVNKLIQEMRNRKLKQLGI